MNITLCASVFTVSFITSIITNKIIDNKREKNSVNKMKKALKDAYDKNNTN